MLRLAISVTTSLLFILASIATCVSDQPASTAGQTEDPERWVLVEEDSWFKLLDEPTAEMEDALLLFHSPDHAGTARAIRKAAVYISISAARASDQNKTRLLQSAKELSQLANDVEAGHVKSQQVLEQAFARAHYALARHHRQKAFEEWGQDRARVAGHYLRSAASHFQRAVATGKRELSEAKQSTLRATRQLADKLIGGGEKVRQRLETDVERAGEALKEIGEEIKPVPPDHNQIK